jgi:tetratricopeptide (TPR) repeat protein
MPRSLQPVSFLLSLTAGLTLVQPAAAVDTVYLRSEDRRVAGEITEVTRESVTVTPRIGEPATVPANDISRIEWDGEPPGLRLARSQHESGQYERALEGYQSALTEAASGREQLRADIEYGLASVLGRLALADSERQVEAIEKLNAFTESQSGHYRYFDALLLLGEVQLAHGDTTAAEATYNLVATSSLAPYQMAARTQIGRVQLERGDLTAAKASFDEVAAMNAASPAENSRRFEAMLGQAGVLQQQGQHEQAATILGEVIRQCDPSDTRLQAEAYLRQGDAYAAGGQKTKQALMAYLHVDVIPSLAKEKDLHAEALYRLSQLWPVLGHAARADIAAGKLQSDYPNSEWARKLSEG